MSSILYDPFKERLLNNTVTGVTIRVYIGRTSAYTVSAAHQFKSSVASVQNAAQSLQSMTITNGQFDGADSTFSSVPAGAALDYIGMCADLGGADSANWLMDYIDGFSIVPNGGDVTAVYDSGANRIYHL